MALRTPQEYIASLQDGRVVYYKGERVKDVTSHPTLSVAVKHACIDYEMAEDPTHRDLAVIDDAPRRRNHQPATTIYPATATICSSAAKLIETATALGRTLVVLIKEIGTDALFALHMVARHMDDSLKTDYLPRVQAFYRHCATQDLAIAVAQTDVKGDRGRPPSQQIHPDYYVRIVDEKAGRHRGARRQNPHFGDDQFQRGDRVADAQHVRGRPRLRRGLRHPRRRPRSEDDLQPVRRAAARQLRSPHHLTAQDDRNADGV